MRDIAKGQSHAAQGLDAMQSCDIVTAVQPIAAFGAPRGVQQPDAVVVMQCAHSQTAALGQFTNLEKHERSIGALPAMDAAET